MASERRLCALVGPATLLLLGLGDELDAGGRSASMGARVGAHSDRPMRVYAALLATMTACNSLPADHAEVRARVRASDGKTGATCYVEINGSPPFLTPEIVEVKTGDEFRRVMTTSGVMRGTYAAARCRGYADGISRPFSLKAGQRVNLGDLVVKPRTD